MILTCRIPTQRESFRGDYYGRRKKMEKIEEEIKEIEKRKFLDEEREERRHDVEERHLKEIERRVSIDVVAYARGRVVPISLHSSFLSL